MTVCETEGVVASKKLRIAMLGHASFDEDKRGSLEVGKFADMVILSENPYEVEKTDLKNIKVEQLLLQGLPYRSCRENIFKAALRGLHSRDA